MPSDYAAKSAVSWWSRLAFWCPLLLIAVLGMAVAAVWIITWRADSAYGRFSTFFGLVLVWALLVVWLLLAQLPAKTRQLALVPALGLPILLAGLFRVEDFRTSGGMWPILQFRFGPSPDDRLDKHLQRVENQSVPAAVDLSGNRLTDWAEYRGRNRDGIVIGPALDRDWSAQPPKLLWRHPIGGGHSSFAVADKALFTLEQRRAQEAITCYDADTGKQYWAFSYPALFDERLGDKGPRSTPTVVDGEVFALGATGMLHCLDARTGKVKWGPVNILAGNTNVNWAMAGSPLVVDDAVIVSPGVQTSSAPFGTAIAYDRKTGKPLWSTSSRAPAGYSSPMLATLAGKRQLLLFDGAGVAGYELDDPKSKGKDLWRYPWETKQQINVAQPLVLEGDRIFISDGYGGGCAMLQVSCKDNAWKVEQLWKKKTLSCKFSSPLLFQGKVYGLDYEYLACIDPESGKRLGRGEHYAFGQVLLCNDLLLVTGEWGELALVDPAGGALRELGRVQALEGRSWNPAVVADGRVYWRNNKEMVCYDLNGP